MLPYMQKIKLVVIFFLVASSFLLLANYSRAATNWGASTGGATDLAGAAGIPSATSFDQILATLIRPIIGMTGIVFFLIFLYGGFKWLTAAGNDTQVGEAKKLITSTVIGLAIVTMAYVIADFIIKALEK